MRHKDEVRRKLVEDAIDRWLRVKGTAMTYDLSSIAPLRGLAAGPRRNWITKVTSEPKYVRERIPGMHGLRISFAEEKHG